MSYYINSQPSPSFNYGNPVSNKTANMVLLPDDLLPTYIETRGFANLTIENDTVTSVTVNQEALDAYLAEYPDVPVTPEPTAFDRLEAQVLYTALLTDTIIEEE